MQSLYVEFVSKLLNISVRFENIEIVWVKIDLLEGLDA